MKKKISEKIMDFFQKYRIDKLGNFLGNFIFGLIILNVFIAIIGTLPNLSQYYQYFLGFEIFSLIIFFIEYCIRIFTAHFHRGFSRSWKDKIKFAFMPTMIFDAIVILVPFFALILHLPFLDIRTLRIIRILRILRIAKYSNSFTRILRIIHQHLSDLLSAFLLIFIAVTLLSTLMFYAEKSAQPEIFSSIPAALYWGIVTMSTIGYGDITPVTDLGRIIVSITAILGVAIYALPTSLLGAAFFAEARSKEAKHVAHLEQEVAILRKKLKRYEISEKQSDSSLSDTLKNLKWF